MNNNNNILKLAETFLKLSQSTDDIDYILANVVKNKERHIFKAITIGDYTLSIQGSESHYSHPRENLDRLSDFDALEILIYNTKTGEDINEYTFEDFPANDKFEGGGSGVLPYTPYNMVKQIINYFINLAKSKEQKFLSGEPKKLLP